MATGRTSLRRAQRRPLSAWVVASLAAALVLMRSCGGAVAGGPPLGTLKTTQLVMPLGPLPKRPLLMQLNARVMLHELSGLLGRPATLDDIQDAQLDELAKTGYHMVYLLGVWKTGEFGLNKSKKLLAQDPCMSGFPESAVGSSPFAITDYAVADDLGGDQALERLCGRIRSRCMRVIVDFVPNHVAIDHAWVTTHPHYLVQSRHGEHLRDPGGYFAANERMFAYGRGLLWEPWEDTVQLNYGEPEVRQAMLSVLKKIAGICDGVRCDVAMLVEQELLQSTWGNQLLPEPGLKALASQQVNSEFWPTACSKTRQLNPSFVFIAESYWEREKPLMDKGFDFCYDKVFYDRLVLGDGEGVDALLNLDRGYQDKLVRFLENHDEDRAANVLPNVDQHMAAAVLTLTSPGLHFVHDGQQTGRQRRVSMHMTRRLPEQDDVINTGLKARYQMLLQAVNGAAVRNGGWERCNIREILEDGADLGVACSRVMTHFCWSPEEGGGPFTEVVVVVVNYSPHTVTARISSKVGSQGTCMLQQLLQGRDIILSDRLSPHSIPISVETFTGEGVRLILQPWTSHIFDIIEK